MFYLDINPVLFKIGALEVRYYGIIWLLGFVIAYFLVKHLVKKKDINLSVDDIDYLFLLLLISGIVGARLFYILVYNFSFYLRHPIDIIAVWHGGLSFHGGFIGGIAALLFFCRKKKFDFFELADILVIPLAFGLFLGRIGNFINGELVGRETNVPWCVNFKGHSGCRHPSQLYESGKNILIFSMLWILKNREYKKGTLFAAFIILYSSLRFFIEFFRAPDPQLGFLVFGLTMGQILNIAMLMIGLWVFYKTR